MSDSYSPILLTVDADGRISADFEGHISAEGLDLLAGTNDTPPEDRKVRWLRESDGAVVATLESFHDGVGSWWAARSKKIAAADNAEVALVIEHETGAIIGLVDLLRSQSAVPKMSLTASLTKDDGTPLMVTILDGAGGSDFVQRNVAATVAALPVAPVNGQIGLIRAGSTPFEFIALVYDATYGKWVSAPLYFFFSDTTPATTTNTNFVAVGRNFLFANLDAFHDAGLRPELWIAARLKNDTAGQTTTARAVVRTFLDGGTGFSTYATGAEIAVTSTTSTFDVSAWTLPSSFTPLNNAHGGLVFEMKVSANTGTLDNAAIGLRWVSA